MSRLAVLVNVENCEMKNGGTRNYRLMEKLTNRLTSLHRWEGLFYCSSAKATARICLYLQKHGVKFNLEPVMVSASPMGPTPSTANPEQVSFVTERLKSYGVSV